MERFHHGTLSSSFYRGSDGGLLVYDVNSPQSLDQLQLWREEILNKSDSMSADFPLVVVGNKIDIRDSMLKSDESENDEKKLTENESTSDNTDIEKASVTREVVKWCLEHKLGNKLTF
jgi:GTPase SAR1 family protein